MGKRGKAGKRAAAAAAGAETAAVSSPAPPAPLSRQWRVAILSTAAAALICKILLALDTYGTNDMYAWERFLLGARYLGVSLYRAAGDFNHPPFLIHVLAVLGWLERATGLPFAFWLRFAGSLADVGSLWLVWKILGPRIQEPPIARAFLLLAGAPVPIMVSGFHGNTDPILMGFLLLSVWLTMKDLDWAAGAAFGLAMSIKIVPVILIPVMFFYWRTYRQRIRFFASAGAVLLMAWSPFLFQDTGQILGQVFQYKSLYGHWGISYLLLHLAQAIPALAWLNTAFEQAGTYVTLALISVLSWWMNRTENRPRLFLQAGAVFFLFLSLSGGFGVQYLAWLAPWVVELGAVPAAIFYASSGVFLFLVYNYWAQGLPWYLADSNRVGDWQGYMDLFQLLCWLSVAAVPALFGKRIRAVKAGASLPLRLFPAWGWRIETALPVAALLVYAASQQITLQTAGAANRALLHKDTPGEIRSQLYGWLSGQFLQMAKPRDAILAAREALNLDPRNAEAYTWLAVAYGGLQSWDEALANARRALALAPQSALANKVLQEAMRHH